MYKVILVDDEDAVREGIKYKTNWAACGYELVGDFNNGRDVLEAMDSLQPDVVITDICMPFMDGLEMAGLVFEAYQDTKIVIITGFEDFEYAKQAIKLKVNDYLLKPINAQEFTDFLVKMKNELDEERKKKEDLSDLKIRLNQSLPLLRERFLGRLVTSRLRKEDIERKFQYFYLSLSGSSYVVLVADIDEFTVEHSRMQEEDIELLRFGVVNILHEIFEKEHGGIVFQTRDDKIAIIYAGSPNDDIEAMVQSLATYAGKNISKYLKLTISVGIGRIYSDLEQLSSSFQEALAALDYRLLFGKNKIISIKDLEFGKVVDPLSYDEWEKKIITAMKTGNRSKVSDVLEEVIEEWKTSVSSIDKCYGSIHKLLVSLMNLIISTGFDESVVFGDDPFSQIRKMKTLAEVKIWLEQLCLQVIQYLSQQRTVVTNSQMEVAEAYIREHYSNENLSLNEVCGHVYMSNSYFSVQFKQHMGETFIEFLTRYRLEKAKELLAVTQLKTYDIALRVGYGDPKYFSVIFKRIVGMTPKEYRLLQKGNP